jgi:hypothetical protein
MPTGPLTTTALTNTVAPSVAARELNLSVSRVRQLMDDGRLGSLRTPLGRLVVKSSLDALVAERRRSEAQAAC